MAESTKSAEALYQALMRQFLHQDRLVYMSIPYLAAIQTATIGGSWAVADCHQYLGAVLGFLGAGLTFCYLLYVMATLADRDVNLDIMDKLAGELIEHTGASGLQVRMNAWPKGRLFKWRVSILVERVTLLFIIADFVLAVGLAFGLRK
ncbi:MAG: hypothetical protein JW993_12375 [Sedimentisphaerales bacterium]|nr:hypothetical protein [Sedimentisphaerales bacterium]